MMNKEEYKKEIVRMWDSLRSEEYKGKESCRGVECKKCALYHSSCEGSDSFNAYEIIEYAHKMIEAIEKWSNEHPLKKFKVSRMEYDLLQTVINFGFNIDTFNDFCTLRGLLEKGYFEGATGDMYISDYYNNCEVVD